MKILAVLTDYESLVAAEQIKVSSNTATGTSGDNYVDSYAWSPTLSSHAIRLLAQIQHQNGLSQHDAAALEWSWMVSWATSSNKKKGTRGSEWEQTYTLGMDFVEQSAAKLRLESLDTSRQAGGNLEEHPSYIDTGPTFQSHLPTLASTLALLIKQPDASYCESPWDVNMSVEANSIFCGNKFINSRQLLFSCHTHGEVVLCASPASNKMPCLIWQMHWEGSYRHCSKRSVPMRTVILTELAEFKAIVHVHILAQ